MKLKQIFNALGIVFSIIGIVSGIVTGINTKNFLFCLLTWVGTFLAVIMYFGIAKILDNQEIIISQINNLKMKNTNSYNNNNQWKCSKCGTVNSIEYNKCIECGNDKAQV